MNKLTRTIAITGITSPIGLAVYRLFKEEGFLVRGLSRSSDMSDFDCDIWQGDISSTHLIDEEFFKDVDIFVHCAAELRCHSRMEETNVAGTSNLLKLAKSNSVKHWIQLGSCGSYGSPLEGSICEASDEKPNGLYETTKTKSDYLVKESGIPFTILRPSILISNKMKSRGFQDLLKVSELGIRFLVPRDSIFNVAHVEDVARAILMVSSSSKALNRTYIISRPIHVNRVLDKLTRDSGARLKICIPVMLIQKILSFCFFKRLCRDVSFRLKNLTKSCIYESLLAERELGFQHRVEENKILKDLQLASILK